MSDGDWNSMRSFNPAKPAEVYDELNGQWFEWKPKEYAALYRRCANVHDEKRHVIEWDGVLLAGSAADCQRDPAT